ncbi:MAG TPA: trigger factor [Gemmatimonadales bacterium]|nr:trigger factor [Gemmatimonadales bacterium]
MSEITIEKTAEDTASRSLRVTVPVDRVKEAEDRAAQTYARRARLPGFRPGKAPMAVVRKRFGDAIRQSVLEQLLRESWEQARESESLKPIADPSIRNLKFEEGSPIEFDLLVEVRPEIKLERIGGFTLTRPRPTVDDAAVDQQLHSMQEQKAAWIPVADTRPTDGELVRVEVAPIDDDGTVGEPKAYDLVLGQQQAVPAVEEAIKSLTPGQTGTAEIQYPDDHPDESRRGQTRRVQVTLHEVKRQELPPLDDDFAGEVGDFDSLDALKAAVRQDLEADAAREADARVRDQLLQQISEANQVPAPESLVHRLLHGYAESYRVPPEQLPSFEQQFHPIAEAQVRRELIMDALVEAHDLRATESEVDARVAQLAEARQVSAGELYASLQKANRLADLERSLTEEKVFDFLLKQSTVAEAES